ncbi:hypothetical protein [uncultured Roseovarius sp.]|uniref:hypothetical protein n=1 Tax=uncultured Roseovarius sp. TaxID=293344 RepID=UPI00262BBDE4|nr:hypothetical protein [uncultured Roseovarius sp.]
MRLTRIIKGMSNLRIAPALLVLLLGVRVATAAAVDCQHDLADAARSAEFNQQKLLREATELGGELCLTDDAVARVPAQTSEAAHEHDGPSLKTPCPFFKSPAALTQAVVGVDARSVTFTLITPAYGDMRAAAGNFPAGYCSRAPPITTKG